MTEVVVVEQKRLLPTERARTLPNVDKDVVHRTMRASHEFGFTSPGSPVHAPDDAAKRTGLRILNERCRGAGLTDVVVEDLRIERPGEQPAVIPERRGGKYQNIREFGRVDQHKAMLS